MAVQSGQSGEISFAKYIPLIVGLRERGMQECEIEWIME